MSSKRSWARSVAIVAVATLAVQCGEDAEVVPRQVRDYISNVGSPDGSVQSTLIEGDRPASTGGPSPDVLIGNATVLGGGDVVATVSSAVPFGTVLLAVEGADDYYECILPAQTGQAQIVASLNEDAPENSFTFEYAIRDANGALGAFVGVEVSVDDVPDITCGDGVCSGGETTETCGQDCPAEPVCGDGSCNGDETIETCSQDCRACGADSECEGTERCLERVCRPRVEGDPCPDDASCPGALYCSRGLCQDGSTGDLCDATADCLLATDICDAACRPREIGEACGSGGACPDALYCGPDDSCYDGSTGDPCNGTADCVAPTDRCEGEPAVCTDVGAFCGNTLCDGDETWNLCPDDCEALCGDAVCDAAEQLVSPSDGAFCPQDCRVTVIFELDAGSNPPGAGEGAWIAGNQAELGDFTPNIVGLLDDGNDPDEAAGDDVFTAAFVFDPGTSLEYKYTIGVMSADWAGTEEYAGGNNRGYLVPSDGIRQTRIHDVWAEQPATAGGMGASTSVTVEAAACVFDDSCDTSRETGASCPLECEPCEPSPCFDGVACSVGTGGEAECGDCPEDYEGDGFTCTFVCVSAECPGNGTQDCLNETGMCQPKDCWRGGGPVEPGFCGSGECFEGICVEDVCVELCDETYGPYEGPIGGWFCNPAGYCSLRMCTGSSDCGAVSECVDFETEDPNRLDDLICISHDASPCSGNCGNDEVCFDGICL